jgi:hypothetical protein
MNRSELETKSRRQLLALAESAGIAVPRGLGKAGLIEALLPAPSGPAELPASYGRTRLTLVEIEPHWIHAYWEITDADHDAALAKAGDAAWVLRFHDVTEVEFDGANARDSFDVPVDVAAGNWYVNLWSGGKTYCAEIGLRAADGAFTPLSRSGVVQVPAAATPSRAEPEWMKVEPLTGETSPAMEPAREEVPVVAAACKTSEPEPATVGTILLPPAELPAGAAIESAGPREFPNVGVPPSGGDDEPKQPAEAGTPTESQLQPTVERAELPREFPLPPPPPDAAEFGVVETNRWCGELQSPPGSNGNGNGNGHAPAESPAAEREAAPSSHSVDRFGTSSSGLGIAERSPSIKLELNAEVVIYGRAMPGQTVEVCGRSVKVNPDGTFSVRMALPLADDAARAQ